MKRIAKIGSTIAVLAALALSMTGCSPKTCSVCGKQFTSGGKTMSYQGVEASICGECIDKAGLGGILN